MLQTTNQYIYIHTHILQRQNKYQRKNTHGGFNCFSCGFFGPNCLAHMTLAIFYWLWQSAQHHVKNLLTMLSMVQQSGCIFHLFSRHDREGKPGKLYEAKWFLRECVYIYICIPQLHSYKPAQNHELIGRQGNCPKIEWSIIMSLTNRQ